MSTSPIDHARRSLDDAIGRCREAVDETHFALRLADLARLCQRDPLLRELVDALASESSDFYTKLESDRARLRDDVLRILHESREADPSLDDVENAEWTAARVEAALRSPEADLIYIPMRAEDERESELHRTASRLDWVFAFMPESSPVRGDNGGEQKLKAVLEEIRWFDRAAHNHKLSHAGAAWREIQEAVALLNPRPTEKYRGFAQYISGLIPSVPPRSGERSFDRERAAALQHVSALGTELKFRLGVRATHDAVVRRYAWSASTFRRERLLRIAQQDTRVAERRLATDVAEFLFAQGFDVLTEVSLGSVRLDLVSFGDALLVEAKRYGKGKKKKGLERLLSDGLSQTLDYVARLRNRAIEPDPFLVIFRLAGARMSLPPQVEIAGTPIRLVVVDLADSTESGSKAPKPIAFSPDELVELARAQR